LALVIFEIDHFADVLLQLGPTGATEAVYSLRAALAQWTGERGDAQLIGENRLAMLWPDCPRSEAVRLARHALATIKPWSSERLHLPASLSLSAGLATLAVTPKNFPADELISAAFRCLSAAQLSGGDTVKSFEC